MPGRLLELTLGDPYENLALEEALLRCAKVPTLRVWENQKSVVLGRAQLAAFETDVAYCAERSIPIVRRATAGGAVYNGPGNINWTFVFPATDAPVWLARASGARGVFESFARIVVGALASCGVEASFEAPNSVVGPGGKISGMAAYISRDATLCHGTLLVSADLAEVERLTKPSEEALRRRYARSRHVRVANCGAKASEFVLRLARAAPGFEPGGRTEEEALLCSGLLDRYRSEEWNLGDPFELDYL